MESTSFLRISIYSALRNCILTLILILFIMEEQGGICEFLVNIYVPCTTKLYPDSDFCKFYYRRENGVEFASFV